MAEQTHTIALTRREAEILADKVPVTNPETRELALKLFSLALDFAADAAVRDAEQLAQPHPT